MVNLINGKTPTEFIIGGLIDYLEKKTDLKILDRDIAEDIQRPCIILDVAKITKDLFGHMPHYNFEINVYYFANSLYRGYADLFQKAEEIMDILSGRINLTDTFNITVEDKQTEFYRADKALKVYGTIDATFEYEDDSTADIMEELNINLQEG